MEAKKKIYFPPHFNRLEAEISSLERTRVGRKGKAEFSSCCFTLYHCYCLEIDNEIIVGKLRLRYLHISFFCLTPCTHIHELDVDACENDVIIVLRLFIGSIIIVAPKGVRRQSR
jgi:hypothetical protein